jgi:hypothetical protein
VVAKKTALRWRLSIACMQEGPGKILQEP